MSLKNLSDSNPDGALLGQASTDKIGFYGAYPVPQRSVPMQQNLQGSSLATLITYAANGGAMANAATATTNAVGITTTGILTTDMILAVNKPTAQAGMGICNQRANAANTVEITLTNPTAANVVPTTNESYIITALRGADVISANLTAALVPPNSCMEQVFTISGTGATATGSINSAGQLTGINVTAGGSGYYTPPNVIITPASPVAFTTQTGTMAGLPAAQGGSGATGVAIISGGAVVGVQITNPGSGYTAAPTISFAGGNVISPGMVVSVSKNSAANAGLGIGGARVVGNNQIGITYFNNTAANITPPANDTYLIHAFNEMNPNSQIVQVTATMANLTAAAANASNTSSAAITGVTTSDVCLGVSPAAIASPLTYSAGGVCTANSVAFYYSAGVPGATPANQAYTINLLRPLAPSPCTIYSVLLTPSAVASNTTAEQVFTLPANVTLALGANASGVIVNKPSWTNGISVVGSRANSTTTLGITYQNNTGASITPPAEVYLIASFGSATPVLGANLTAGYHSQVVNVMNQHQMDLVNEMRDALSSIGIIAGR